MQMPFAPQECGADVEELPLEITPGMGSQGSKYSSVCQGPDNRLYFCPYEADSVAIFDVETKELAFISHPQLKGRKKYLGICLGPDGRLYCAPARASSVMAINPKVGLTEAALSFIGGLGDMDDKYSDICLAPNGQLCCCPFRSQDLLVIDPWMQSVSFIAGAGPGYMGICVAPDGLLYCAPFSTNRLLVVDVDAVEGRQLTFVDGTGLVGEGRYIGIAAAPNGKLYCAPWNGSEVLVIDPLAQEESPFTFIPGAGEGERQYCGLCAAADGKLYCAPHGSSRVLVIDPTSERLSFINDIGLEDGKYRGICPGPSGGWLHFAPWNCSGVLSVKMLGGR